MLCGGLVFYALLLALTSCGSFEDCAGLDLFVAALDLFVGGIDLFVAGLSCAARPLG